MGLIGGYAIIHVEQVLMEVISYIIGWELGCIAILIVGIFNLFRKRRKLGSFLVIVSVALLSSMFIVLPFGSYFLIMYPLTVLLAITSLFTLILFKRKKIQ